MATGSLYWRQFIVRKSLHYFYFISVIQDLCEAYGVASFSQSDKLKQRLQEVYEILKSGSSEDLPDDSTKETITLEFEDLINQLST